MLSRVLFSESVTDPSAPEAVQLADGPGYAATKFEVSLARSLSILSQVATLGGTSVNLRWKRDY